jgi:outer membrane protein TolC
MKTCQTRKWLRNKTCVRCFLIIMIAIIFQTFTGARAQQPETIKPVRILNLDQCISYALQNQPGLKQSLLEISIVKKTNAINLSNWLPQVGVSATYTHYTQLPTIFTANPLDPEGALIKGHSGFSNTFLPQMSATQTIINPDVLKSARSATLYVKLSKQSSDSTKINLITNVSKSFYNLLFTLEQMKVLEEDTARLVKNLNDAYHQYVGGVVDKTDYKEARILLNNSKAQLKQAKETVKPEYAILKQFMGFPPDQEFMVSFDTVQMLKEIAYDTGQLLQFENRIEFQQLQTVKNLQKLQVRYYKNQFLPSLSAFYNYIYEYQNNSLSNFLNIGYPYSYYGASLNIPIFSGLRRIESIRLAKLQEKELDLSEVNLKSVIYSEYTSALSAYKSNLNDMNVLKENLSLARDVYAIVSLQYKQGLIAYLNVITAESNLISSEISYLSAMFQVLSSKVDLKKAMGNIVSK